MRRRSLPPLLFAGLLLWGQWACGQWIGSLVGHRAVVRQLAVSPDGKLLASASNDGTVILWNISTGRAIKTLGNEGVEPSGTDGLRPPSPLVLAVEFSTDGKSLATGGSDRVLRLWDVESGQLIHQGSPHGDWISAVCYSPDGKYLATASWDRTIRVFTPDADLVATLRGHEAGVNSLAFAPDGKTLASGCADGMVGLWDVNRRTLVETIAADCGSVECMNYSKNGEQLAIGGWSNQVLLIDTSTMKTAGRLLSLAGPIKFVAFSPDGDELAVGGWHKQVELYDVKSLRLERRFTDRNWFSSCVFINDGRELAAGGWDGAIRLWSLTGSSQRQVSFNGSRIDDLAIDASGSVATFTTNRRFAWVWHTATSTPTLLQVAPRKSSTRISLSPDGNWVASTDGADALLWSTQNLKRSTRLTGHRKTINDLAFSPDGMSLTTVSSDKRILIWNASNGTLEHEFRGHLGVVRLVAYHPAGRELVTVGENLVHSHDEVKIWDSTTGQILATLESSHTDTLQMAVSADGKTLATASEDGQLQIWNLSLRKRTRSIAVSERTIDSLRFLPDGTGVAVTAGRDMYAWTITDGAPSRSRHILRSEAQKLRGFPSLSDFAVPLGSARIAVAGRSHRPSQILIRVIDAAK